MIKSLAALYCVYNDYLWLPYSYQSIYALMDRIYFLASDRPWQGPPQDNSRMLELISRLPDPQSKVTLLRAQWPSELEQRNASLGQARADGLSHAFVIDADEIYETSDLETFIRAAGQRPEVSAWHVGMYTYWKSIRYCIDPPEPHAPAVLLEVDKVAYNETRNVAATRHEVYPPEYCLCHHMSYARPDEMIVKKHIFSPGHSQSMHSEWYEKKWKAWDSDHSIGDLHPVDPPHFKRAVEQKRERLPSVVRHVQDLPEY